MTTRIHVVNYGPQPVVVDLQRPDGQDAAPATIHPLNAQDFYVYKGQVVVVREQEQSA
jgi:hypothetical protein